MAAGLRKPAPRRSFAEAATYELKAEWHPSRNLPLGMTDVAVKSGLKAWWSCGQCQFEWQASVANRVNGAGCPACGRRRGALARSTPKPGESLAEVNASLAAQWDQEMNGDLSPFDVRPHSSRGVRWRCLVCGHGWTSKVAMRARGRGCPKCARRTAYRRPVADAAKIRDLFDTRPDLVAEWHSEKNGRLDALLPTLSLQQKLWWRCATCQFEWDTKLYNRERGHGCRPCATKRSAINLKVPAPGRSLADLHPNVASQWHPTRNGRTHPTDVRPTSRDVFWWKDIAGHSWQASAVAAIKSSIAGCPNCLQWGTSADEIRLRCELEAAGFPIDNSERPEKYPNGRNIQCDMVCPNWKL
ncbi:zinc-ribbon domain-containing protein, partial [Mycobacteroides chelonae]|uniref:zinc-ribbon domain-containing protein n=1 Tax=Mycobacteroides chelonae TaxID=1774 RepID=UPI003B28CFBC